MARCSICNCFDNSRIGCSICRWSTSVASSCNRTNLCWWWNTYFRYDDAKRITHTVIILTLMLNRNWSIVITFKDRYEFTGINDFTVNHLKQQGIKKPSIIDVGCSTGIAMKKTAEIMRMLEFDPYITGIDASKKVKSKAEKNLDEFINRDVLDIDDKENTADVVICSKAAIFVLGTRRAAIIRKCTSFLKDNGILITDVDSYPPRTIRENAHRFLRFLRYQFPNIECFKHGIKNIRREYGRRANTTIRNDVFKMTKHEAMSYVDEIIKGWEKRSPRWKLWWRFRILIQWLAYS